MSAVTSPKKRLGLVAIALLSSLGLLATAKYWTDLRVGWAARCLRSTEGVDARRGAAKTLLQLGTKGVAELEVVALARDLPAATSHTQETRQIALDALQGTTLNEERLARYLRDTQGLERSWLRDALARSDAPTPELIDAAVQVALLDDGLAGAAALFLSRTRHNERSWSGLKRVVRHGASVEVRVATIAAAFADDSQEERETLRELLADPHEAIRVAAAAALADVHNDRSGVGILASYLRPAPVPLRAQLRPRVSRALSTLGDRRLFLLLLRAEDPDLELALRTLSHEERTPEGGWAAWWEIHKAAFPEQMSLPADSPGG